MIACLSRLRADSVTRCQPTRSASPAADADLPEVKRLLRADADSLGFPLDFQDFDRELAELPGSYAPPRGALLVARIDGVAAGCVGLRPLDDGICELKRLYVHPEHRGLGLGWLLAAAIIDEAGRRGYRKLRLDTAPGMQAAHALYARLGFRDIPAYTTNPIAGTRFMELDET
jgi:putative acetyltransferase